MASSSKPTGVHYALVVFVLATIACGVGWLVYAKNAGELRNAAKTEKDKATAAEGAMRSLNEEVAKLKLLLGSNFEKIGPPEDANTVTGDINARVRGLAPGIASPTYNDTLAKMSEMLRATTAERDKLKEQLANELNLFEQQKTELNAELAAQKNARTEADKGKSNADNIHAEELARKEADLTELKKAIGDLQQEYDDYKDATEKRLKALDSRVANLLAINKKLGDELEQKTQDVFDVADGQIVWVDSVGKRVWVNLGSADGLRPRTTFSVYKKDHAGVGRGTVSHSAGPEDIKGAIEITRIRGPHEAEARILPGDDIYNPIGRGDPIYTPLWSPGRGEAFSIVGVVDLDGDGKSDRDILREIINAAGGIIDNEVDDEGNLFINGKLEPSGEPKITERTKFLVKGKFREAADATADERSVIEKIDKIQTELVQQARERAVRVVSLSDFLSFIGYRAQRRLFVPGDTPFNIKKGERAPSTQPSDSSLSTGSTSAAYSGTRVPRAGTTKPFRKGAN